ncbi:MAG TPA: tRNA (N6-threonylcarbamoyladenosine(37)-N6)-methyltransferase TrmO [Methanocorpusculum sp.]|nr:tRNA (N6-threonylcarbamoyladenosine(37)-N6)-methyltransferase TrmO [Methanocorpusculum sp.]MBR5007711.1 tRNA (N6-threonylcarbamoyladenosine(37)-N6)-methyltransferase TrmO [Methanocorpusculum sp.]MBR5142664.1 tRNA (N6-threonylcarbamoyladenosine(37)-N6)-methyltransferase TrmO [Methanocorpusculum sp.]MBR5450793.1 tRNA (N6-threonylcarbamoyladenosine(37)-N6)-methyltransferase TrmO [Methanocorpusculum sp.]HJJ65464.1 tRNA (N6-threonylcarbamoyladenosine(37)-N6)-methyltransferase TrmO [Methanocorpusc
MDSVLFSPVGVVHSLHKELSGMPVQPPSAAGIAGEIEIFPEFAEGLLDIEGFSRIMVFYHLHRSAGPLLSAIPFLDTVPHGVFASRIPRRPNPLGFSVVRLLSRDRNILKIADVDILDGTPVLDIKPYVPEFDSYPNESSGWFAGKLDDMSSKRSDDRFV